MASKKIFQLLLMISLFIGGAQAQLAGTLDFSDSSKFRAKKIAQYNEWLNGLPSSPFAPKPRDAWQLSLFGGYAGIFGDVRTATGWGAGIGARKAIGYVVSVRPSISYRKVTGIAYENQYNLNNLPQPVRDLYRLPPPAGIGVNTFLNYYQSEIIAPALDFIVSLNNIMFHRTQSNYNYYLFAGYSPVSYTTNLEVLDNQGRPYNWAASGVNFGGKRRDIISQIKDFVGTPNFETEARVRGRRNNFNESGDNRRWAHGFNLGAGVERRLGDVVTISAEFKYTSLWNEDWVDGVAIGMGNAFTPQNDALFAGNIGVNFNLGVKGRKKYEQMAGKDDAAANKNRGKFPGKRVAPLWQHNPLGQPYGELSNPTRMNMPAGWLQDSDGDGVPDQFDLEPNTPAGAPVDNRGRARDTDGDGVPDYLDKELITPTYCQPVDADGVGKCPDPECCKGVSGNKSNCDIGSLPSVQFVSGRSSMGANSNAVLDAAAAKIKANPSCKICVVGYGGSSKREQQLSWDRVNSVINYLVEKQGISRDRFVFKYGEAGDANTVDLQDCTGESGPNMVPAPHPQYRTSR